MKCTTVLCPTCGFATPIPPVTNDFYESEVIGEVSGDFHCINCGIIFSVTATVKIDEAHVFKVAEFSSE